MINNIHLQQSLPAHDHLYMRLVKLLFTSLMHFSDQDSFEALLKPSASVHNLDTNYN